jgi:hypothetical protein
MVSAEQPSMMQGAHLGSTNLQEAEPAVSAPESVGLTQRSQFRLSQSGLSQSRLGIPGSNPADFASFCKRLQAFTINPLPGQEGENTATSAGKGQLPSSRETSAPGSISASISDWIGAKNGQPGQVEQRQWATQSGTTPNKAPVLRHDEALRQVETRLPRPAISARPLLESKASEAHKSQDGPRGLKREAPQQTPAPEETPALAGPGAADATALAPLQMLFSFSREQAAPFFREQAAPGSREQDAPGVQKQGVQKQGVQKQDEASTHLSPTGSFETGGSSGVLSTDEREGRFDMARPQSPASEVGNLPSHRSVNFERASVSQERTPDEGSSGFRIAESQPVRERTPHTMEPSLAPLMSQSSDAHSQIGLSAADANAPGSAGVPTVPGIDAGPAPAPAGSADASAQRSQSSEAGENQALKGSSPTARRMSGPSLDRSASLEPGAGGLGSLTNAAALHPGAFQDASQASGAPRTDASSTAAGLGPGNAFQSLDADGRQPPVRWVHTGAQRAEAGFEDSSLGWVSVRANGENGSVQTALVPSSEEAAHVLAGHLAGLNGFLSSRTPGAGDVTIASPESGATGMGAHAGSGQGSQEHPRQSSTGESSAGETRLQMDGDATSPDAASQHATSQDRSGEDISGSSASQRGLPTRGVGAPAATSRGSGGAHISVMA